MTCLPPAPVLRALALSSDEQAGEGDPALDPETLSDVFRYSGYLEQIGHMVVGLPLPLAFPL